MSNSLKIGVVSGLIAGFTGGIILEIFAGIAVSMGLWEPYLRPIATNNIAVDIPLGIVWGIIFGIIYSRAYYVIPNKGVAKGLVYGFFLYLIAPIRIATFLVPYAAILTALAIVFCWFFTLIVYALLLEILYAFLGRKYIPTREEPKTITYDMKSGLLPGAIAGIAQGLTASIANLISYITRLFGPQAMPGAPEKFILDFWISQSGSHIVLNIVWGIVFGLMFPKVYSLVPGKGITKGLCYSFVIFLTSSFLTATYWIAWGALSTAVWQDFIAFFAFLAFGLVLGALYRKPSD